ncbi:MAG: type IV pilus modification protein PilV [Sedimenticolaceae bacterium]
MNQRYRQRHCDRAGPGTRTRGFTLLEVLVALIVLSIGLLGLSGLQTTGLRGNHSALLRSEATMLANDILDRMRANRTEALKETGGYNIAFADSAASAACSANCLPAQVANADLFQWRSYVERLPGGQGQVDVTSGVATISIQWVDDRSGATSAPFVTVTAI